MLLYPIFINIKNKCTLLVGAGEVAYRKAKDLLDAGANIKIVAPLVHEKIEKLKIEYSDRVDIIRRNYQHADIEGSALVFAATNDQDTNKIIFEDADKRGIPINSVDDPENCSFYVPSLARRGDLVLAVSTSGASPAMAARLRRLLEDSIPNNIDNILDSLREARSILHNMENLISSERGNILKKIVNDDDLLNRLVEAHTMGKLEEYLMNLI